VPFDGFAQVLVVEVRVDFGRDDVFVPQHLLHLPDRSAAFEQMRGERVAEGVGADACLSIPARSTACLMIVKIITRESRPPRLFRKSVSSLELPPLRQSR